MEKSMETQIVTDASGEPVRVIMDYQEYVKMIEQLNMPLAPTTTVKERNPLDWYSLTESANSILNGLVALASRETRKEQNKPGPDQKRIEELGRLRKEAIEAVNSNENFSSLERMEKVIEKYSPILLAEKKKLPVLSSATVVDYTESLKKLYTISDQEFREIQQDIITDLTVGKKPSDSPIVIILGGQPGAGKTELERIARTELGGDIIVCNADLFRDYHPNAEEIKNRYEAYYPEITAKYAQDWNNGLRAYCEATRMNYILETTFSSGTTMNKTIDELTAKGLSRGN